MPRAALLTVLLLFALPGIASASRPATPEEADAVAAGADGARGMCATVTMSTVDATWVASDLGFCKPQRGYMVCANRRATAVHREFDKPRTCNTLRPTAHDLGA